MPTGDRGTCPGCGWPGGGAECRARFEAALARDYSDVLYFGVHRMLVDAYCLQHPDDHCASAKSLAAHLAGLCAIIEEGAPASVGPPFLHKWLSGRTDLVKPPVPDRRGETTLGDLEFEAGPGAWADAVRVWAEATWQAYAPLHGLARDWLARAKTERG